MPDTDNKCQNETLQPRIHYKETAYGFEFGSAEVMRVSSDPKKGWVVMRIKTPSSGIQIYCTKTGKMRILKEGEEDD